MFRTRLSLLPLLSRVVQLAFAGAFIFDGASALASSTHKTPTVRSASLRNATPWQALARAAGNSEDNRATAIARLKRTPHLTAKLRAALATDDRPLAIEAIGALQLKSLVPDMIKLLPTDEDGFLTIGLNAMMTDANRDEIVKRYLELLKTSKPCATVAMLEPLGRLGIRIPRSTLLTLNSQDPDVRAGLLYYLRMTRLRSNFDLVESMTRAPQEQLRQQALSIAGELRPPSHAVVTR